MASTAPKGASYSRAVRAANDLRSALEAVSVERIAARLARLSRIGQTPEGGVTRLGLTSEEREAHDLVGGWLAATGFASRHDDAGNLMCSRGDGPWVLAGSHLDTVPNGGAFDGALGVVAAVEVAESSREAGLDLPLAVAVWMGEEGPRFGGGLFGSATATGLIEPGAWDRADAAGVSARQAAAALLGRAPELETALLDRSAFRAYLEVHMEQSSVLAESDRPVGLVTRIVGISHGEVRVEGTADHAGATRMHERGDALAAASECVLAVERLAREAGDRAIATVGELHISPGAPNVIPGSCTFSLDVRAPEDADRRELFAVIDAAARAIGRRRGVQVEVLHVGEALAAPLDGDVIRMIGAACAEVGVPDPPAIPSRAAHDAQNLARFGVPTGMVFVRSTGGSHNPFEQVEPADAALGAQVLLVACSLLAHAGR